MSLGPITVTTNTKHGRIILHKFLTLLYAFGAIVCGNAKLAVRVKAPGYNGREVFSEYAVRAREIRVPPMHEPRREHQRDRRSKVATLQLADHCLRRLVKVRAFFGNRLVEESRAHGETITADKQHEGSCSTHCAVHEETIVSHSSQDGHSFAKGFTNTLQGEKNYKVVYGRPYT